MKGIMSDGNDHDAKTSPTISVQTFFFYATNGKEDEFTEYMMKRYKGWRQRLLSYSKDPNLVGYWIF